MLQNQMDDASVRVTLLGTGTSSGIPVIGCRCRVCTSTDPRDARLRCSCYVQTPFADILIDTGPDFRYQALRAGIANVDAVLITHHHFDHVAGLDDLRPYLFSNKRAIPCYTSQTTATVLERMFAYIFRDRDYPGVANLDLIAVDAPFYVRNRQGGDESVHVIPIPALHGDLAVLGFRIGGFAYLTDTSEIPDSSFQLLDDLDVLVLDGLRHEPHTKHFTVAEAVAAAQRIGARKTFFIHMAHTILHAEEDALLPEGMHLGHDGLSFSARLR